MSIKRIIQYDIIRIIACLLIVLMHSPMPTSLDNSFFVTSLSFLTEPAIGLFFMVSGALLLPIKSSSFNFLLKRFTHIGVPLIAWSILFLYLKIYYSESEINILSSLFSIPFSNQGHGILWFLYTLLGLYLLTPILSRWLQVCSKKELEFILLIWSLTLIYPLIENYIHINESQTGILYYFEGYAGYFLLGFYLKHYKSRVLFPLSLIIGILGVALILYLKCNGIEFNFYRLFWYLSIFIASWSIVYWYIIYKLCELIKVKQIRFITKISQLTFGVYLIHILIMRDWLWKSEFILSINNYFLQTFVLAILTFLFSILCCYIISKIPYIRSIIGYKPQILLN